MGIIKKHTDTLEGKGTVEVGTRSYPAAYRIKVLQEFHETRTGEELSGVVDLEGLLTLVDANAPTSLGSGSGVLTLEDNRRVGIVFPSLFNRDRQFPFLLGNAMDFFGRSTK
jgi:hypothetical protein